MITACITVGKFQEIIANILNQKNNNKKEILDEVKHGIVTIINDYSKINRTD